jgi:DNA invertase Pin-like site-specific DNA recombinase
VIRVVGYPRVSTDEQASGGVSLEAQEAKIRTYCGLYELELICVISDPGERGKSLDRPGLKQVLELLDRGDADGVVIAKLDRLTRSVIDLGTLLDRYFSERKGKQLFSVADSIDTRTAAGRLVLNVLISVAQWERETIVERTKDGMNFKRSRGERLGQIPYGYQLGPDGKKLEPCLGEQSIIITVHMLRGSGSGWSLRKIASYLNENRVPLKHGGERWYPSSVATILRQKPAIGQTDAATEAQGRDDTIVA